MGKYGTVKDLVIKIRSRHTVKITCCVIRNNGIMYFKYYIANESAVHNVLLINTKCFNLLYLLNSQWRQNMKFVTVLQSMVLRFSVELTTKTTTYSKSCGFVSVIQRTIYRRANFNSIQNCLCTSIQGSLQWSSAVFQFPIPVFIVVAIVLLFIVIFYLDTGFNHRWTKLRIPDNYTSICSSL